MKIKVCGLRDIENIKQIMALGVDMIGFDFIESSPRYVSMVNSGAGFMPDYAHAVELSPLDRHHTKDLLPTVRTGVFADTMPQTIVTRVVNYQLDCVQLDGQEEPVMIENLKRTLIPDLQPNIKVIKTMHICEPSDFSKCQSFAHVVDVFRLVCNFNDAIDTVLRLLKAYNLPQPYILAGNITAQTARQLCSANMPNCWGLEINEQFETAPAVKDVAQISALLNEIR